MMVLQANRCGYSYKTGRHLLLRNLVPLDVIVTLIFIWYSMSL